MYQSPAQWRASETVGLTQYSLGRRKRSGSRFWTGWRVRPTRILLKGGWLSEAYRHDASGTCNGGKSIGLNCLFRIQTRIAQSHCLIMSSDTCISSLFSSSTIGLARDPITRGRPETRGKLAGSFGGYESLWLPASLLENDAQQRLADALFASSRYSSVELHFNKGLAGAPPDAIADAKDTAMNPAVLTAFALAIAGDAQGPAYPGIPGHEFSVVAGRKASALIDA